MAIVTSRFPFPLEKGDKLRAYYQIKELSKHFDLKLIALSDQPVSEDSKKELEKFCSEIHIFNLSKASYLFNAALHFIQRRSFQVGYFYNHKWIKEASRLLKHWKPVHIYTQLVRCTEYTKHYHDCPKTLDYMDALATGIERRGHKSSFFLKKIFNLEANRLRDYERRIFEYYDYKTIISDQDKSLIKHPKQQQIFSIPNGIDHSFLEYPGAMSQTFDIGFIGNMNYAPNVDAVLYVENKFLKKHPQITFLIAGANPQEKVLDLGKKNNITVAGWIDDIRTAYADMKLFVAPMQIGTGMQNKLLEAMAMSIPCITTSLANIHLLAHPNEARKIGQNAKEWVAKTYSWEKSTETLLELMHDGSI